MKIQNMKENKKKTQQINGQNLQHNTMLVRSKNEHILEGKKSALENKVRGARGSNSSSGYK